MEFCFDFDLAVSKTAVPTFDRTYNWTLEKTVLPETWSLFAGDSGTSKYTVSVAKGYQDSNWAISGVITIYNPAPDAATVNILDELNIYGPVALSDCSSMEVVAAYGSLVCHYSVSAADGSTQVTV